MPPNRQNGVPHHVELIMEHRSILKVQTVHSGGTPVHGLITAEGFAGQMQISSLTTIPPPVSCVMHPQVTSQQETMPGVLGYSFRDAKLMLMFPCCVYGQSESLTPAAVMPRETTNPIVTPPSAVLILMIERTSTPPVTPRRTGRGNSVRTLLPKVPVVPLKA